MTKITQMPRIIVTHGMTALIILLTSLFTSGSLDIAMHDTYFVVSNDQLIIATYLLFSLFALITWGINKMSRQLSSLLNWLHYSFTIICLVIIVVFTNKLTSQPATYRDYSVFDEIDKYESQMSMNEWFAIIGVILILNQFLFLINIIRAFIVKKKSL